MSDERRVTSAELPEAMLIGVRNPHGGDTCVARSVGFRGTGSSTNSPRAAAEHLARRMYGAGNYRLDRMGDAWTFRATRVNPVDPASSQSAIGNRKSAMGQGVCHG